MQTRILFIYAATYLSPPWVVTAQILRYLDRSRFDCHVAIDDEVQGDLSTGDGVQIERLALGSSIARAGRGNILAAARVARSGAQMVQLVKKERIQIIHATDDGLAMSIAWAVKRATGARLLIHFHAAPAIYRGARLAFTREMARAAECNLGVSGFIANEVLSLGVKPSTITYVMNGIDSARFRPDLDGQRMRAEYGIAPDEVVALQMSRIWQPKRQIDLVRALALAVRESPRLRGLIVGWEDPRYVGAFGSYKEELLAAARETHLGDRLIVARARPEAEHLHAAADLFVMPSTNEPFGLVVAEAMATARPVIGAVSGALPEIIEDGITGFLVPALSPERIAEKMVVLARDAALRQRLGKAGRRRVETDFQERRVSGQVGEVYEAMARGARLPTFQVARA